MYICDTTEAIKEVYCILRPLAVPAGEAKRKLEVTFGGNFNAKEIHLAYFLK